MRRPQPPPVDSDEPELDQPEFPLSPEPFSSNCRTRCPGYWFRRSARFAIHCRTRRSRLSLDSPSGLAAFCSASCWAWSCAACSAALRAISASAASSHSLLPALSRRRFALAHTLGSACEFGIRLVFGSSQFVKLAVQLILKLVELIEARHLCLNSAQVLGKVDEVGK